MNNSKTNNICRKLIAISKLVLTILVLNEIVCDSKSKVKAAISMSNVHYISPD
jgi:hypothetical protein